MPVDGTTKRSAARGPAVVPPFSEALRVWARIGLLSFGGPAGQIALMHREIVEQRGWLSEEEYLNALNFCMLLPGPEAMQLATYAGWRLHGVTGGLAAGLLFVLPGALVVLALSIGYALFGNLPLVEAAFLGIKAAVLVIVIEALLRISRRALKETFHWGIAAAAFVAIFFFGAPFPAIVLAAGLTGYLVTAGWDRPGADAAGASLVTARQVASTIGVWLAVWLAPLAALMVVLGPDHVLVTIGLFFSKLAVVTFGGAYAVLAYMGQQAVETYGWMSPGEMLDGLGLAETTPGPLILVTQFVGFLAAARSTSGEFSLLLGLAGAAVTLWVTFAPCFLWIFAGAPFVERLSANPRLKAALTGITAAVVGVILNLSLWFGLHVLWPGIVEDWHGPLRLWSLAEGRFDAIAGALTFLAAFLLLWLHRGLAVTLGLCAALGIAARLAT